MFHLCKNTTLKINVFMVVLPMFKYKQDIFQAVIDTYIENQQKNDSEGRSWTDLHERVKERLGRNLSPRDFSSHVKNMINEGILLKEDTGQRGKRVSISLTKNAKRRQSLGILGQGQQELKSKKILQLIIFFHLVKPPQLISRKNLDKLFSSLSVSQKDLVTESHFHTLATGYTETNYKPIKDYKFRVVETYDRDKKMTLYYYKRISFLVEDIIKYIKRYKKVAIDNTKLFPFIKRIRFLKVTEEEIKKVFDTLRDENIIRPTQNIFDKSDRHIAFIISDDDLQGLINQMWRIRNLELEKLQKKLTYLEGPTEKEKEWLELTYGSNQASIIIHKMFCIRNQSRGNGHIETRIESLEDRINQRILNINEKYRRVIEKFDFPPDILNGICLNKIF